MLLLLDLGLTGAAWLCQLAGQDRVSRLDLTPFEPADSIWDVYDRLRRDGSIARHILPYLLAAVGLDALAVVSLSGASLLWQLQRASGMRPDWRFVPVAGACFLLVTGSGTWHLLGLLVTSALAG